MSESATLLVHLIASLEADAAEIADIRVGMRERRAGAKAQGFCLKAVDELLRRRKMDGHARLELDGVVAAYEAAVGLPGLPIDGGTLEQAALPDAEVTRRGTRKLSARDKDLRAALGWACGSEGLH